MKRNTMKNNLELFLFCQNFLKYINSAISMKIVSMPFRFFAVNFSKLMMLYKTYQG